MARVAKSKSERVKVVVEKRRPDGKPIFASENGRNFLVPEGKEVALTESQLNTLKDAITYTYEKGTIDSKQRRKRVEEPRYRISYV